MLSVADRLEIAEVLSEYCHMVDRPDWSVADKVLADDFEMEVGGASTPKLVGAAGLRGYGRPRMRVHLMANVVIEPTGADSATVHSNFFGVDDDGIPVTGWYEDVVVRTSSGWRLSRRRSLPIVLRPTARPAG